MFQTTIRNVAGMIATDIAGKALHIAGAAPVVPGQKVWTDGTIIYGNTYGGGDTPIIIPKNGFIWLEDNSIWFTDNISKPFEKLFDTDSLLITADDKGNLYDFGEYVSEDAHISLMTESDACIDDDNNALSIYITGTEWYRDEIKIYKNNTKTGSINFTEHFKSSWESLARSYGSGGEVHSSPWSHASVCRLAIHPNGSWNALVQGTASAGSQNISVTIRDFGSYIGIYRRRFGSSINEIRKVRGLGNSVSGSEKLAYSYNSTAADSPCGYRGYEEISPEKDSKKYLVLQGDIFKEEDKVIVEALLNGTGLEGQVDDFFDKMFKLYSNEDSEYKGKNVIILDIAGDDFDKVKIVRYCPVGLKPIEVKNSTKENDACSYTWELDDYTCHISGNLDVFTGYMVKGTQTIDDLTMPAYREVKDVYKMKDGSYLVIFKPGVMMYTLMHCENGEEETLMAYSTDFRCSHLARIRPVRKSKLKKVLDNG